MQRARRLASVAGLALAGIVILSGCSAHPGVAAKVGETAFTEEQVTRIYDEVRTAVQAAADAQYKEMVKDAQAAAQPTPTKPPLQMPISQQDIVSTLVRGELCARLAADKGYHAPVQVSAEQVAGELGLPAKSEYAQALAKLYTCQSGLPVEPVAPTAEEMADLVARGKAAGVIDAEKTVQDVAPQLDGETLRRALGQRNALAEAAASYQVTVSPRYRPLEYPVLSFQGNSAAVSVPLGEGESDAVINAG